MSKLTLKLFKELTKDLPENTPIYYHAYYKGCCLNSYVTEDMWFFPHDKELKTAIVLNPGEEYDGRRPKKI